MALHEFGKILIKELEALTLLDGRYSNIRCVNVLPGKPEKRGCFSLVFSAIDTKSGKPVALKFFDPDPSLSQQPYRVLAFERESEILKQLLNSQRCLQLVEELKSFEIELTLANGTIIKIPCRYFAVEWLDQDIDEFFLSSGHSSIDKLRLFNIISLAVEALHNREVFHRDLKADNLRMTTEALSRVVIAIDLGTAARFDSGYINTIYDYPVGAQEYSAPEAMCGLAGNRLVAHCSDIYALGCLFFELFNKDYYFQAIRRSNPDYDRRLFGMSTCINQNSSELDQIDQWRGALARYRHGIVPVDVGGPGSTIEAAITPTLNEVLHRLCDVDFANRKGVLPLARAQIRSMIMLLENEAAYQRRLEEQRMRRRARREKVAAKDRRIAALKNRGDQ